MSDERKAGDVWNPFAWDRRRTRVVRVGDVGIGGENPIRIQSMTTTDTQDTEGTIAQVAALAEAGCEIVRITAPSIRDAENLAAIKAGCLERGARVPLVADIHFTPNAAMEAALHVEKVRINPGNYADKKRFEVREYSDAQYREELDHLSQRFRPLVLRCKELGRAMRIGTNHGSLSDRIMNRFGDTPEGMVESALEFLEVCEREEYPDIVFSMKASNPQVAIHAYRLLANRLAERVGGWSVPTYPFHIGVTEAGDGEDGRVKSAIGIGALLEDGIGETVRVSLTESPVKEIPVAAALAARYDERHALEPPPDPGADYVEDPSAHHRRATRNHQPRRGGPAMAIGGREPVRVEADLGAMSGEPRAAAQNLSDSLARIGDLALEGVSLELSAAADVARASEFVDALSRIGVSLPIAFKIPVELASEVAVLADRLVLSIDASTSLPTDLGTPAEWSLAGDPRDLAGQLDAALASGAKPDLVSFLGSPPTQAVRLGVALLAARGLGDVPLVLRHRSDPFVDPEVALLRAATDLGAPLCDGLGDLVSVGGLGSVERDVHLAYRILQGARQRTSWTEFISCPSCGRTLFDLEETTARIKAKTSHLPGLKIAVMGCIVNGPGEMADADFGYVGSGQSTVNLYVGHECVVRNVAEAAAPDRLVDLIRAHDRWVDP